MTTLAPFMFDSHSVRVLADDTGAPWFVGRDVAEALGYADPKGAVARHCKKAKSLNDIGAPFQRPQQNQSLTLDPQTKLIPEGDVFRIITSSHLPRPEAFESLVMDEILPTIRRTGRFDVTPDPSAPPVPDQLPADLRRAINRRANTLCHATFERLRHAIEGEVRQRRARGMAPADLALVIAQAEPPVEPSAEREHARALRAAQAEILRLNPRPALIRRCVGASLSDAQTATVANCSATTVGRERRRLAAIGLLNATDGTALIPGGGA